jgi:hypothetical protein
MDANLTRRQELHHYWETRAAAIRQEEIDAAAQVYNFTISFTVANASYTEEDFAAAYDSPIGRSIQTGHPELDEYETLRGIYNIYRESNIKETIAYLENIVKNSELKHGTVQVELSTKEGKEEGPKYYFVMRDNANYFYQTNEERFAKLEVENLFLTN